MNEPYGSEIYRRTLCFILSMAANKVFPERRLVIGHSLGSGIFYELLDFLNNPLTEEDLKGIETEMRNIISQGNPIRLRRISWQEAVEHFGSMR